MDYHRLELEQPRLKAYTTEMCAVIRSGITLYDKNNYILYHYRGDIEIFKHLSMFIDTPGASGYIARPFPCELAIQFGTLDMYVKHGILYFPNSNVKWTPEKAFYV